MAVAANLITELTNLAGVRLRLTLINGRVIDGFVEVASSGSHISLVDSLTPPTGPTHFVPVASILIISTA